jgi:hypothetical protein
MRKQFARKLKLSRWFRIPASLFWKFVVVLSVIVGLIAALLTFLPRLSMSSSESLDPSTPFSTPFVVSNDGLLSINDVTCYCLIRRVVIADRGDITVSNNIVYSDSLPVPNLAPGEKTTVSCPPLLPSEPRITRADMDIVLRFRPYGLPWYREKAFRFTTEIASDKRLHWYPRSGSQW